MTDSIKLKVVTHYSVDDPECLSDYWAIKIYMNDTILREYEDDYHDKGEEKLEGYLDALHDFFGESEVVVEYEKVADMF